MAEKIVVIGDVMLDVYHFCRNRENPESSAPCYTVERTEYRPGGAGNVAANLAKLGTLCEMISVVGLDEDADRLERMLIDLGVNPIFIRDSSRQTIIKERYLSSIDKRYHFRADFEKKEYIPDEHVKEILKKLDIRTPVIISDYNKGVISEALIEGLRDRLIEVYADLKPVHKDLFKCKTYLIKPNVKEAREMTGLEDEIEAALKLRKELGTNILLTRGKNGTSYFGLNGERYDEKPSISEDKVVDVTGAGDSVMATFCHFLNKGYKIRDCVRLANRAGEISVQYPGCYQVSEKELGIN